MLVYTGQARAFILVNGRLADLKVQETPFFKAQDHYGIDPQYAVSFNGGDYVSYKKQYPEIDIYFWVNWKMLEKEIGGRTYKVKPLVGFYRAQRSMPESQLPTTARTWTSNSAN